MRYTCEFNDELDLASVRPSLAVDLVSTIESGVVPDSGVLTEYNDISDPSNVYGRVSDPFEAIEAQKAVLNRGKIIPKADAPAPVNIPVNPEGGKTE